MKNFLILFALCIVVTTAVAQNPKITRPAATISFNGRTCDPLIARLIDPKDFQSVALAGVGPEDMTKTTGANPTGMNVTLKENIDVMDIAKFFTYYKVPVENQEIIKVNGTMLKTKDNFLASKTMIEKVTFSKDLTGKSFTNITTVSGRKK